MKNLLFVLFVMAAAVVSSSAQIKNTENTLKLEAGQAGEKATIADIEWLAGNWIGTGFGGISEENWSKPIGGIMVGTFRMIKDGKPIFYETCWMMEQDGTLILRLKHFHANLLGWEEKDKTVDFQFVKKEKKRVYFNGLTFEKTNATEMNIFLAMRQKDGPIREEVFRMKRNK